MSGYIGMHGLRPTEWVVFEAPKGKAPLKASLSGPFKVLDREDAPFDPCRCWLLDGTGLLNDYCPRVQTISHQELPGGYKVRLLTLQEVHETFLDKIVRLEALTFQDVARKSVEPVLADFPVKNLDKELLSIALLAKPLLDQIDSERCQLKISKRLAAIHPAEREEVVSMILLLMSNTDLFGRVDIIIDAIDVITSIWRFKRREVMELAQPWLEKIEYFTSRTNLLRVIQKIPVKERGVARLASRLFEKGDPIDHPSSMMQALLAIRMEEREAVVDFTLRLLNNIDHNDYADRYRLLQMIHDIPSADRERLVEETLQLADGAKTLQERLWWLSLAPTTSMDQRVELLSQARPLLEGITNIHVQLYILRSIQNLPEDKRMAVISEALPECRNRSSGYERVAILRSVLAGIIGTAFAYQ